MQYTENYSMNKPQFGENALVTKLNENADTLDTLIYNTRQMQADTYDSTQTYNTGDLVSYNSALYRCLADNVTGTWDATKWVATNLAEEVMNAGGGESALADLEDVNLTNPSNGQLLAYDEANSKWVNGDVTVTKTASGNPIEFTDGADAPLVKCTTAITGSQDLHGYDKPWVGGAGKNKLPMTVSGIKALNTSGTWSGNTYTVNGLTFSIITDNGGNVTGMKVNGTANAVTFFSVASNLTSLGTFDGTYVVNGGINGGSETTFALQVYSNVTNVFINAYNANDWEIVSETTPTANISSAYITIRNGYTANNLLFKPMIRLATETDPTFEPYSNICPITAYNQSTISVGGDMGYDTSDFIPHSSGVTKTVESDGILFSANGSATYQDIAIGANNSLIVPPGTYTIEVDIVSVSDTNAESMFGLRKSNYSFIVPNIDSSSVGHKSLTVTTEESTYISMTLNGSPSSQNAIKIKNFKLINVEQQSTATFSNSIYQGNADFVGSEAKCDWKVIDFASLEWRYYSDYHLFTAFVRDSKYSGASSLVGYGCVCSCYHSEPNKTWDNFDNGDINIGSDTIGDNMPCVNIREDSVNNVSDFLTLVAGQKLAYELATPTTETITPTNLPIKSLSGYNHIESSTGDMEVEYITEGYQPLVDLIQSGNGHTYSTQEQVVGKWIDGSDVYEKSFKIDNISDDSNHVLDATLTQSAITLLPGTEIIVSCTGTYNTDFNNIVGNSTFGRVIANVNGLNASIVGYSSLSSQLGACTLYVTARYLKKSVSRSLSAPLTSQKAQIEPLTDKTEEVPTEEEKAVNEEENNDETR